jgi:hypothetical protein
MRYGPPNMTDMTGIGNYVGEIRRGPTVNSTSGWKGSMAWAIPLAAFLRSL